MEYSVLTVVNSLRQRINEEELRLSRLKEMQTSIVQELDGLPRGNSVNSRIERLVVAIATAENTISSLKAIKAECAAELWRLLDTLIIEQSILAVMFDRYGRCKLFRDIGIELGYSESRVYQLHRQGLLILGVEKL